MASTSDQALRVAIVGGGVSGLSTAYYLMQRARRLQTRLDIQVFEEKETLGGNADTVVVNLGRFQRADGTSYDYLRWADLGVNDANLATYTLMKQVMTDIGYLHNMQPLQDTDCFHLPGTGQALTDDASLVNGVSDPRHNLLNADNGLLWPLIRVVHQAALDRLGNISPDYTCAAYFKDCIEAPSKVLGAAATQLDITIDWHSDTLRARLEQVRDNYYYPRIAAMYFTDPRGPDTLPLCAPFEYYRLQEGGVTPDRRYFAHGAQTWIEALAGHLATSSDEHVSTTIHRGELVTVSVGLATDALTIQRKDGGEFFDICVMANHADDAAKALRFHDSAAAFAERLRPILGAVRYTYGYAVCHTAAGRLPANRNVWRTYNIPIRSASDSLFPYRIDYVVNLHQNDSCNFDYGHAGLPVYFVSLVDDLNAIPREEMLERVTELHALPEAWRASLPEATRRAMLSGTPADTGYRHQHAAPSAGLDGKAWTAFKHNVLDAECIRTQQAIKRLNQDWGRYRMRAEGAVEMPALLFGGGWTCGAGLQEQCLEQSQAISAWILPG